MDPTESPTNPVGGGTEQGATSEDGVAAEAGWMRGRGGASVWEKGWGGRDLYAWASWDVGPSCQPMGRIETACFVPGWADTVGSDRNPTLA